MNFEQIRTIIDQKDEKGWPQTRTMLGVIHEFKGEGMSDNKKPFKKVSIKDDEGELHNVTLRGMLPDISLLNQRAQFNLSSYNGSFRDRDGQSKSYIGYSGFWDSKMQVAPQMPQGGQTPPAATQTTYPSKREAKKDVDWDAKDRRNARMNGLNNAIAFLTTLATVGQNSTWLSREKAKELAGDFVNWIYSEKSPKPAIEDRKGAKVPFKPNPDYVGDDPEKPEDDSIPF